jgi:3-dehydroquinate synthase
MSDPFENFEETTYDVSFVVPMVHRLRFTEDCFGADFPILHRLLDSGDLPMARTQVWLDDGLVQWKPDLISNIESKLQAADKVDLVSRVQTVPGGECVKNSPDYIDEILSQFNHCNLDRRSYVLVIGGGAVLDAVGYAAAIAHRGIRLIRVPTTTLAQADSGVGVKNAVNWFKKKNWKGTFATPWAVVNDRALLAGLSRRDFVCGFSEAVKVALLKDREFFEFLRQAAARIAEREPQVCSQAIRRSVLLHLQHITRGGDPFENLEARPLDFGHWSAHKLEAITNFGVRHGEAVSIGVAIDTAYSHLKLGLSRQVTETTIATLRTMGLPIWHESMDVEQIFDGLEEFRQHLGGRLTITFIEDVGKPIDVHTIDRVAMRESMDWVRNLASEQPPVQRSAAS